MNVSLGKLLVGFHPHISSEIRHLIHKQIGITFIEEIPQIHVDVVHVNPDNLQACLSQYCALSEVKFVEQDGMVHSTLIPNDPLFPQQYGLTKIKAPEAWDLIPSDVLNSDCTSCVLIAILDSGLDLDHPDLDGKIVLNANFSSSSNPEDETGHGTHVGGIAGAVTNNSLGVAGVTFNAVKLMNIKVLNEFNQGSFSGVAMGIIYAADNGADVINMSLSSNINSSTLQSAVEYAAGRKVILVASAGNNNTSELQYPAAYPEVTSVAATNENDQKASFSSFGASWVDVAAPGVSILSTFINGEYRFLNGTSMSAPFVSGLAGLILAVNPSLKDKVRRIIESTTDRVQGTGTFYRYGRVNALKAIQLTLRDNVILTTGAIRNSVPQGNKLFIDMINEEESIVQTVTLRAFRLNTNGTFTPFISEVFVIGPGKVTSKNYTIGFDSPVEFQIKVAPYSDFTATFTNLDSTNTIINLILRPELTDLTDLTPLTS
ncbi:S8 family peptidase [Mesobacillus maritimus]|uniref:S8 family peptidase n=1 Tax=Mesobacillus maritimus TaxID=1643336 RepID=UPI00384A8D45